MQYLLAKKAVWLNFMRNRSRLIDDLSNPFADQKLPSASMKLHSLKVQADAVSSVGGGRVDIQKEESQKE